MHNEHREDLLSYIYEATQDAYNYRPNMDAYEAMSVEELMVEAQRLSDRVSIAIKEEEDEHRIAGENFEAFIAKMMSDHNIDRETAIRWDMDALNIDKESIDFYGMDWYGYHHGLKMGYFSEEN